MKDTSPRLCEIIYVKKADGTGWKWRAIESARSPAVSDQTYPLFYDCVRAARARGYEPNVKCL